jgi:hypothetical protein
MEFNPTYETIGTIFEKNFLFEVPKYQRYYAWGDEQVDDFTADIDNILKNGIGENKIEHFFGSIVCARKTVHGSNRQQKELIDGQQRITTALLLIINILRMYEKIGLEMNGEIITARIKKIKEKYLTYQDEINRHPQLVNKLELSSADNVYFQEIINGQIGEEIRDSHKRLKQAYIKIQRYINQVMNDCNGNDEKIDTLGLLENILHNNCSIIFIDTDTRDSAYKLFQVLNNRGAGLTEGDLLKSKILEALEKNYASKQDSIQRYWDEILQEDPRQNEEFLRTYYASVCGSRAGRTSLYDDFLKKFFPEIFEQDILETDADAESVTKKVSIILNECKAYRKIINGDWPYEDMQPITEWDRRRLYILTKYLNYEITYPLLLAATKLNHKIFAKLVLALEIFMFRYKTICNNGHQKLSVLFSQEAQKIREDGDSYSPSTFVNKLRVLLLSDADDAKFSIGVKGLKYKSGGNRTLRYFFSMLCEYYDWYKGGAEGKPKVGKEKIINLENLTIEHICPQGSKGEVPIFDGDDVHQLANLTVLTSDENDKARNKKFSEKRTIYIESKYTINKKFESFEEWTYENAEIWRYEIINMACKIFSV